MQLHNHTYYTIKNQLLFFGVVLLVFTSAVTCADIPYFAASMAMSVNSKVNIEFCFDLSACPLLGI